MSICKSVSGERLKRELQIRKQNEYALEFFFWGLLKSQEEFCYRPIRRDYNRRKCSAYPPSILT